MIPRGFLILLSGGGMAQVITIAALPVLGRLYDPTNFGQLAAVMAIVSLAMVVVHGRYHTAIPVANTDKDAQDLLALATLTSALLSLPMVVVIYLLVGRLPDGLPLWAFIGAATIFTFFSAMIDVLAYWRSHRGRFKVSAQNNVARNAVTVVTQIGLAFVSGAGLLVGAGTGVTVALALAMRDMRRHDRAKWRFPSAQRLRAVAYEYRTYPFFGVPQGWLAALSWNAMPLLLLKFGGTAIAGQYWVAYRLMVAPVTLFSGTYRQAILPVLRDCDEREGRRLVARHSLLIATLGCLPLATIFFFGAGLFVLALGPVWGQAGTIAGWLAVGILAEIIKDPAICLLQSQARHARILIWEASIVSLRYAAALPSLLQGDGVQAVAIFSCAGFVGWLTFAVIQLMPAKGQSTADLETH